MRVASAALHFGPPHSVAAILFRLHDLAVCWGVKARPTAPGIKLGLRPEQRLATTHTLVRSSRIGLFVLPAVRWLGSLLPGHIELILREFFPPLGVALSHFSPPHPLS